MYLYINILGFCVNELFVSNLYVAYEESVEDLEGYEEESESESEEEAESPVELDARTELMIRMILDYNVLTKQISIMKLGKRFHLHVVESSEVIS